MKHLLNNLSEEEKNSIREQHEGGMKIATENFKQLLEAKSGEVKPYLSEQKNIMLPSDLKINLSKDGGYNLTVDIDNRRVSAKGDLVKIGTMVVSSNNSDMSVGSDLTITYDCGKDSFSMYVEDMNDSESIDGQMTSAAKNALKNVKTYCSGSSVAL